MIHAGIGLGHHVHVALQHDARRVLVAGRGRLHDAQVVGLVAVVRETAIVRPGFDLRQDRIFVPGRARCVAEGAEVLPEQRRFEVLEVRIHDVVVPFP